MSNNKIKNENTEQWLYEDYSNSCNGIFNPTTDADRCLREQEIELRECLREQEIELREQRIRLAIDAKKLADERKALAEEAKELEEYRQALEKKALEFAEEKARLEALKKELHDKKYEQSDLAQILETPPSTL
jgi:predicted  nucleic acid-binding Zn-ribbon protein